MKSLQDRVFEYIQNKKLIHSGDKVLVGVSGGGDSIALLHLLYDLSLRLEINLLVTHFDHQLRPDESQKDCVFVQKEAEALRLPFLSKKMNIKTLAKDENLSLEETARDARYSFFEEVAQACGAQKIAAGHTREDQAETILLRILRGTGPEGLQGMKPARSLGPLTLIRPLLFISRNELREYLKEKKLEWREDASNDNLFFTRNRVRKVLIPLLEKEFNPQVVDHLNHLSETLECENKYLNDEIQRIRASEIQKEDRNLFFNAHSFKILPQALQTRLIRNLFRELTKGEELSFVHVKNVLSFLSSSQSGRSLELPQGLEVWLDFDRIFMGQREAKSGFPCQTLLIPGEKMILTDPFKYEIFVRWMKKEEEIEERKNQVSLGNFLEELSLEGEVERVEHFDGSCVDSLLIRSREAGDLYDPIGLGTFKKIKEILIDQKIPRSLREAIPLFLSKDKILWVGGYRISESFKVKPETQTILEIRLRMVRCSRTLYLPVLPIP
ncbi:MAG: tRNA lysidine(34) synthetase TilS [Chlamydiae bacterium]|nr:tRNA lysidine(34) synthetase TilS [Chlamydiota bacterium]MBI3276670.1 tRNA lysidine(34) synthetase TilS [Chlamydiota bacterium]